jgi:hypothetical protein
MLDIIGQIIWFSMFVTPVIAFIWWRIKKDRTWTDLVIALSLAFCISSVCFFTALAILLRDGLA